MNFDFSEDQKFLGNEARKFLESSCTMADVRTVLDDKDTHCHQDVWKKIIEMGWAGAAIPEEYGGLGLGMLELCVLAEEMGRVLAPVPFSSSVYYVAEALKLAGTDAQKSAFLPGIADGSVVGCLALSEGPGQPAADALKTAFDGQTVSGTKLPVMDGDVATHAIVLAKEDKGASLAIVSLGDNNVSSKTLKTLDPTRSHAELVFEGAKAERLGAAGEGEDLLEQILNRAAILTAFEQLGGAARATEMAIDYAKERYAFGRPIGGNQAIKHKLADMYVKNEIARSNCYYGAWYSPILEFYY